MTRKTRIILFSFLALLFFIIAPLIVFYSLGWRFDWKTKKITQPGVFYIKVLPKNVQVYLNGELKKKTGLFFGSALIENLPPTKYDVEIRKQEFHTWKKTLEIQKRKVTEAKNIILIPQNPGFTLISKGIKELFFSPNNKKIVFKEAITSVPENPDNPGWALKLFEIDRKVKSHLMEEKEAQLLDLNFSSDSNKILLKLGGTEKSGIYYYLLNIDESPPALFSLNFIDPDVERVDFNPKDPQKLFLLYSLLNEKGEMKILSEINLIDKKVSPPLLEDIITYSISNDNIYYLNASGFVFKTDFAFDWHDKLNREPLSIKQEVEYKIKVSFPNVFLKEDTILYVFNEKKQSFEKINEHIKDFKFSPDSKKMVYFNNYEIWILFLDKIYEQPQKQAGDQVFLTRFSEKIGEVFWYANHYLIFNTGDKIKVAEIDDRDTINIVDLKEFKKPKIFWNQASQKLYILSEGGLYRSEKLIP